MGPRRKSVAELRASGSRHYSKAQLEEREKAEIKPPPTETIKPPSYLPKSLVPKFQQLSPVLIKMGVLTSVDGDCLARYLLAEANYLRATNRLTSAMNAGNTDDVQKWASIQDRFFKQCRAAGSDLGLTVSGRGHLQLPAGYEPEEVSGEEADLFGGD